MAAINARATHACTHAPRPHQHLHMLRSDFRRDAVAEVERVVRMVAVAVTRAAKADESS